MPSNIQEFSRNNFPDIPGPFPTIPDHNTVRPADNHYPLFIIHYPMRTFNITLITSLLLIVGGFITPPIGQIDGSVLTAVGMLVLFATVEKISEAIKAGRSIKVQKGNFCAEIEASD